MYCNNIFICDSPLPSILVICQDEVYLYSINGHKIYYQKEQISINSEKIKKEYEDLLNQKSKDKTLLLAQKQNLENDVSNLTIALSNAKKEIIRLNEIKKNLETNTKISKKRQFGNEILSLFHKKYQIFFYYLYLN